MIDVSLGMGILAPEGLGFQQSLVQRARQQISSRTLLAVGMTQLPFPDCLDVCIMFIMLSVPRAVVSFRDPKVEFWLLFSRDGTP